MLLLLNKCITANVAVAGVLLLEIIAVLLGFLLVVVKEVVGGNGLVLVTQLYHFWFRYFFLLDFLFLFYFHCKQNIVCYFGIFCFFFKTDIAFFFSLSVQDNYAIFCFIFILYMKFKLKKKSIQIKTIKATKNKKKTFKNTKE